MLNLSFKYRFYELYLVSGVRFRISKDNWWVVLPCWGYFAFSGTIITYWLLFLKGFLVRCITLCIDSFIVLVSCSTRRTGQQSSLDIWMCFLFKYGLLCFDLHIWCEVQEQVDLSIHVHHSTNSWWSCFLFYAKLSQRVHLQVAIQYYEMLNDDQL